jgi:ClpP class serine protease
MTEAHKEQMTTLMNDLMKQVTADIAAQRKVSVEIVQQWFEKGAFSSAESLENKIVDRICYRDESYEAIAQKCGFASKKDAPFLFLAKYHER